jgi:hypothetical protein
MNFSTNQVLHFYVNDPAVNSVVAVGSKKFADGAFSLEVSDSTGVLRSDKIENVMWVKKATAAKQVTPYMEANLQFSADVNEGAPIAGQNYIVRVSYPSVGGTGIEAWTTKTATAYAKASSTAETILEELATALNEAFAADGVLVATADGSTLNITQSDLATKTFEAGVRPAYAVQFTVTAAKVVADGEEVDWLTEDSFKVTANTELGISGSYKLADMEYFALGERGDEYRMMGWPNVAFKSKDYYKIDVAKDYDVYTIHFASVGANANHKMEKEIVIATIGEVAGLEAALTALGAKVETK